MARPGASARNVREEVQPGAGLPQALRSKAVGLFPVLRGPGIFGPLSPKLVGTLPLSLSPEESQPVFSLGLLVPRGQSGLTAIAVGSSRQWGAGSRHVLAEGTAEADRSPTEGNSAWGASCLKEMGFPIDESKHSL